MTKEKEFEVVWRIQGSYWVKANDPAEAEAKFNKTKTRKMMNESQSDFEILDIMEVEK